VKRNSSSRRLYSSIASKDSGGFAPAGRSNEKAIREITRTRENRYPSLLRRLFQSLSPPPVFPPFRSIHDRTRHAVVCIGACPPLLLPRTSCCCSGCSGRAAEIVTATDVGQSDVRSVRHGPESNGSDSDHLELALRVRSRKTLLSTGTSHSAQTQSR